MKMLARSPLRAATAGGLVALISGALIATSPNAIASSDSEPTPAAITPPPDSFAFLTAHAVGTQNYICQSDPGNPGNTVWSFLAPQATLSADSATQHSRQVSTHFLSTVPGTYHYVSSGCTASSDPNQQYCPTWQSSRDSSKIWGSKVGSIVAGTDPSCPNAGAIACLLLQAVATTTEQPRRGLFSEVTYVQRLNTAGGSAPTTSCTVGQLALVPYTADYTFFSQSILGE
jgi:Protein of unknown function (DUF3455)